jgi:alpha-tubulin suppressor-like RCC1 family protein
MHNGYNQEDIIRRVQRIPPSNVVLSLGQNDNGQLANGREHSSPDYQPIQLISPEWFNYDTVTLVSCGRVHTLFLCKNGVYAAGRDSCGQLGLGHDSLIPKKIRTLEDQHIVDISAGGNHSLFLDIMGTCYSCGQCSGGELGRDITDFQIPLPILQDHFGENLIKAKGGDSHSVFITGFT